MNTPSKPYLLFDAGGTLVFPDFEYIAHTVQEAGIAITEEALVSAHHHLIFNLDKNTRREKRLAKPFPNGYFHALLEGQIKNPKALKKIITKIDAQDRTRSLWTATYPWVGKALAQLAEQGYRMSVISNADGRAEKILIDLNIRSFFDQAFDSHLIGYSKPDSRLFQHALKVLNLHPADAIYIGDAYYYDVWGANQAGLGSVHLDPHNLYSDWPGSHIASIAQLPQWLERYQNRPSQFNLFSTKGEVIKY